MVSTWRPAPVTIPVDCGTFTVVSASGCLLGGRSDSAEFSDVLSSFCVLCVCVHVQGSVQSIVFLPNGKHMLTSGKIGTVLLYVYNTKHMIVV